MDVVTIPSRRSVLKGLGLAGLASAVPVAAIASAPPTTAEQRRDFHLAEFKRACEELDPMIGHWSRLYDDQEAGRMSLHALRLTGRYEGDGTYALGRPDVLGRGGQCIVALRAESIDGERSFMVRSPGERMVLTEPALQTFIGRKLAGV